MLMVGGKQPKQDLHGLGCFFWRPRGWFWFRSSADWKHRLVSVWSDAKRQTQGLMGKNKNLTLDKRSVEEMNGVYGAAAADALESSRMNNQDERRRLARNQLLATFLFFFPNSNQIPTRPRRFLAGIHRCSHPISPGSPP